MRTSTRRALPLVSAVLAAAWGLPPVHAAEQPDDRQVLWFQDDLSTGVGIVSQDFDAPQDAYDSQGADDFSIPKGTTWRIQVINVSGTHFGSGGRLRSLNLVIYKDSVDRPSRPGEVVASVSDRHIKSGRDGNYQIVLAEDIKLPKGKYWLSMQGNPESGEWGWMTTSRRLGKTAAWRNPADGYQTGCTDYQPQRHCFDDIGQGGDFMFSLYGRRQFAD
jgi:hypothetical protein